MVSRHQPATFGGYRHCGSGDMTVLVVEGQDFTYSRLSPPFLLSLKHLAWNYKACHINKSDPGHTLPG